jgi:hypothetical protein
MPKHSQEATHMLLACFTSAAWTAWIVLIILSFTHVL